MTADPVETNPDHYRVVFENDRVRVLDYTDGPGVRTVPHHPPDSVMYTLTEFDRRLGAGEETRDVHLEAGLVRWLGAQEHWGENIGSTSTHVVLVELKEPAPGPDSAVLGPSE
jgi:beta-alanine degradation protein BauB